MRSTRATQLPAPGVWQLFAVAAVLGACLWPASAANAQTCPNEAAREQQHSTYLPECRGYELSSPVKKNGEEVSKADLFASQVPFQASLEDAGIAFATVGALPESSSGGLNDQYVSYSSAPGSPWSTLSLQPDSQFQLSFSEGDTGNTKYYSPNLSCGVEQTELPQPKHGGETQPQLPPGETAEERVLNLYVWRAAPGIGSGVESNELVSSEKPANAAASNESSVDGATADCKHIIFQSGYEFLGAPPGSLYEWSEGTLHLASVLPDGRAAESVSEVLGGEGESDLNQLTSEVASGGGEVMHTIFTAHADEGADQGLNEVFIRRSPENGTATTVEASAPQHGASTVDTGARFQAASKNGNLIFFTANYGLTPSTSTGSEAPTKCEQLPGHLGPGCDLYVYDGESGSLTDISADKEALTGDKKGAGVRSVLGISEDGAVVYFAATGQLVPGQGNTQVQNEEPTHPAANVYAFHDGKLSYVSTIGQQEAGDSGAHPVFLPAELDAISGEKGMQYTVSRVPANGEYLLFATNLPVREYDGEKYENRDQITNEADYELYEYSLTSEAVTCVSCNPDRAVRPIQRGLEGPFAAFESNHDGYLTRTLTNNGEVFFDSVDPLVSQATNKTVNVYEWQPDGIGGCELAAGCVHILDSGTDPNPSYFADASANGENVFITTQQALAPQDQDGLRDVYDVRVDGGILEVSPGHCLEEGCPEGHVEIGSTSRASETGIGGGNPPLHTVSEDEGKHEVESFTAHSVSVKHTVKGRSVTVSVSAPAAGHISISGAGLKTAKKTVAKAGAYKLVASLTAKEAKVLERKRHVKLTLHIMFAPTSGHATTVSSSVTFNK
jgi:hypothetical protein